MVIFHKNYQVGGAITMKNDGVRQWVSDDIPYMKWKIKMFETTNQLLSNDKGKTR